MNPGEVGFLGPEGTFTSEAARLALPGARRHPLPTIADVFEAVRAGGMLGVVPLENSIEGSVNATLDELAFGPYGCFIRREVLLAVSMNLLAPRGARLADVTAVRSHPQGLAQCRRWLAGHLPAAAQEAATSTAEAARAVADGGATGTGVLAAIGTTLAAERYGLDVLAADIHDYDSNATRFAVLGDRLAAATGADKTSLVVFFGEDRPGLLLRTLDEFALRGINLTKIESRPTKTALGEYCIFIDCEGHPRDARVGEALRSVHRHVAELRVLGAYPRAEALPGRPAPSDTDEAYREAESWHRHLLERVDPS